MAKKLTKKQKAELKKKKIKKKKKISEVATPPVPEIPTSPTPPASPEGLPSTDPAKKPEKGKKITCSRCGKTYSSEQGIELNQKKCCPYCGAPAEWKA